MTRSDHYVRVRDWNPILPEEEPYRTFARDSIVDIARVHGIRPRHGGAPATHSDAQPADPSGLPAIEQGVLSLTGTSSHVATDAPDAGDRALGTPLGDGASPPPHLRAQFKAPGLPPASEAKNEAPSAPQALVDDVSARISRANAELVERYPRLFFQHGPVRSFRVDSGVFIHSYRLSVSVAADGQPVVRVEKGGAVTMVPTLLHELGPRDGILRMTHWLSGTTDARDAEVIKEALTQLNPAIRCLKNWDKVPEGERIVIPAERVTCPTELPGLLAERYPGVGADEGLRRLLWLNGRDDDSGGRLFSGESIVVPVPFTTAVR